MPDPTAPSDPEENARSNAIRAARQAETEKAAYKAIIVDGVDVLLLRDHVAKAATGAVLEGNARGLGPKYTIDVVAVVKLEVEAFRNLDGSRGITVLHNDQVVGLEEGPPHFQEIKVANGGDHNVQLVR